MLHATSSSLNSLSKMQMGPSGCNERQITQSCTFSAVGEVLRLYLLCPCQPLLRGDRFDKRAQRGFMRLFPSYCQYKHCHPSKHTFKKNKEKRCWIKEAHFSFKEGIPAKKDYATWQLEGTLWATSTENYSFSKFRCFQHLSQFILEVGQHHMCHFA